jgi:hypothetical protein
LTKNNTAAFSDHLPGNRIESLDILRGIAIMVIVVLHRLHYNWAAAEPGQDIAEGTSLWLLYLLFYLMTMAGIFSLICGSVNSFNAYRRKAEGKSVSKYILSGGLSAGFWILLLHYIQSIFFANGFAVGRQRYGILTGWMQTGEIIPLTSKHYVESNALSMIGLVVIFISIVLFLVLRKRDHHNLQRDIRLFIIIGTVILVATPFVRYQLGLYKTTLVHDGKFFGLTLTNLFIGAYGMFPFLAFGFYGAAIGAGIAGGVIRVLLKRTLLIGGLSTFLIGGIGFFILGGLDFNTIFANTMSNQFHWILFRLNQLGFFILLYWFFLSSVDFASSPRKQTMLRIFYPARFFGLVSLTVFICEPIVAEILKKLCDLLLPGWNAHLILVIFFGLICLLSWWCILNFWWKTVQFAGSFEWLSAKAIHLVSGKMTTRSDFAFMTIRKVAKGWILK